MDWKDGKEIEVQQAQQADNTQKTRRSNDRSATNEQAINPDLCPSLHR